MKHILPLSFLCLLTLGCSQNEDNIPEGIPNNEIHYISTDGEIVFPSNMNFGTGVSPIDNVYENNKGIITFDKDVTTIGDRAFEECKNLSEIILPNSITEIRQSAFSLSGLTSITIPKNVTRIDEFAFYCTELTSFYGKYASNDHRCLIVNGTLCAYARKGLTEYDIPEGVKEIGASAFYSCALTQITLPESVEKIGETAFYASPYLTSITLPKNIRSIDRLAFGNCRSIEAIYCKAVIPTTLGSGSFYGLSYSTTITYVPRESVDAYKAASGWETHNIVGNDF